MASSNSGLVIDPVGYGLNEEETAFYQKLTGIDDDEALRDHLVKVQAEALAVCEFFFL